MKEGRKEGKGRSGYDRQGSDQSSVRIPNRGFRNWGYPIDPTGNLYWGSPFFVNPPKSYSLVGLEHPPGRRTACSLPS